MPALTPAWLQGIEGRSGSILSPITQEFGKGGESVLSVSTPEWVSRYGAHVIVRGWVQDGGYTHEQEGATDARSLWWEILDTDHRAKINCAADGSFAFAIPTLGLPRVFYLRIVATDSRGQTEERIFELTAESRAPPEKETPVMVTPSVPETVAQVETEELAKVEEERPRVRIPVLTLTQPRGNDYLSSELPIRGKLIDEAGRVFPPEEIESVAWEVEGSALHGQLEVDEGGSFAEVVDAEEVRRDALLVVRAVASDGRIAELSVRLRADISGPPLAMHSPREGERYGDTIIVQGSAWDGEPVTLHWKVLGVQDLSGERSLPEAGDFQFEIPASRLDGVQVVELRAEDQLGNATVSTVTLAGRAGAPEVAQPADPAIREPQPPPELIVESPADRSHYHSHVRVEGLVTGANALYWEISGSGLEGSVAIGKDGRFSLKIPSADLQGTQMLRLSAAGGGGGMAEKVLVLLDHEKGPEIAIRKPENRSYYRRDIQLEGSVGNLEDDWDSVGEVAGLTLRIAGREDAPAEIPFDEQGSFSFLIQAEDFSGKLTIILTAEDRNGDLNQNFLTLQDGNLNPTVSISSPQIDQRYGSRVRIRGEIIDPYAESETLGGIDSIAYNIASPEVFALAKSVPQGEVELWGDNSFDFVVTTRGLSGPQDVNIVVIGRSGNQTKASVRILEGEADIPVFSAEAGDRCAVLRWDELPTASRYTLSYRPANPGQRQGREIRIDGVSSPYVLTGLENGNRYEFSVEAALPGEPYSRSAEKWATPLSPDTLKPATAGEFEQIRISWPSIPGCESYVLWRSESREGKYVRVAQALPDTKFLDRDVQYGRSYYYKVSPASAPEFPSGPVPGESTAFPVEKLETAGLCRLDRARGITLYGGYAFVADGSEGVKIVDISDPDSPAIVGGIQTAEARDVAAQGEYAFVADGERGLKVLDISDPRAPAEIGMRKTMDARALALQGDRVFIADGSSGLKIIDVSSPVQPTRIGSFATEDASDLVVRESQLYVADGEGGLRIFEVSDSADLVEVGRLPGVDARSLAVEGSLLYLAAGAGGLIVVDISDPEDPIELGRYSAAEALDVGVSGTFAYLADSREGMIVLDVSDPARPCQFAGFPAEEISSISVRGQYAYLATGSGLQVVHILIQGRSVTVASGATGGKAYGLYVSGPRAYVACHDLGVLVVDISDPGLLGDEAVIGSWAEDYAVGIEIADSVAFVANGRRGLSILDLEPLWDGDPLTQPLRIGSYYTGGTAHTIVFRSPLLFVADGQEGLKILDVTAPNNPVEIGSVSTDEARDVAVIPGYALVADEQRGLLVCDISDPSAPVAVDTLSSQGLHRIVAQGSLVAAAGKNGVDLYDISDPRHPELTGRFESSYVESIDIHGPYLYIADGYRGLQVVDIQSFDRPVQVSACPGIYAVDVAVYEGYALVADSRQIHVVKVLIPEWLDRGSSSR